jgi:hypothetical protein
MVGNLGAQVRDNPLALAMIGAGMAWLMMGKGAGPSPSASAEPIAEHDPYATDETGGVVEGLKAKSADLASEVGGATSRAKDRLMGAAGHAKHGAQRAADQAAQAGHKLQRTFLDTLEQEPLVVGALGLAVGAAIGASLPSTRLEDRTFGKARDRVVDRAKQAADEGLTMARDAAEAAYQGASEEAENQRAVSQDGGSLVEKAETIVQAGIDAAKDRAAP